MSETLTNTPLFVEIAESLKQKGTFQRDFTESGIANIMSGVITSLISSPEAKDQAVAVGGVEDISVGIKNQKGTVSGNVQVIKPMEVKIPVKFVLKNSTEPENLKLDQISIGSGFTKLAIAALGKILGVNVEAEAREKLKNPNAALAEAFSAELLPQGVKLTGVGLHFKDDVLSVSLKGESANRPKLTKAPEPAKSLPPAEEVSPAEREFQRKKLRIERYLIGGDGMDFLARTWDETKWEHVGENGSVKRVYRPLRGVLAGEKVCVRENISDNVILPMKSASELRQETKFLQTVKNPYFVRVYAHAPLDTEDSQGTGRYKVDNHWELVDFVDGVLVNRVVDREWGAAVWPETLTPATRLRVLLAACECEHEATNLNPPVYLTDLKTGAFIVHPDGAVKMVDVQTHDKASEYSTETIVKELARLCLGLFQAPEKYYPDSTIEEAVRGYLNPEWDKENRRWDSASNPRPDLYEILKESELPGNVQVELRIFLDRVKSGGLKFNQAPMDLARRILPIAQRLEREESAVRAEKLAAEKRQEAQRRVIERSAEPAEAKTENWERAVKKLIEDPFAQIAYEQMQSVMAAAAAYSLSAEISNDLVGEEQFIGLVKRIATLSQNMRPKKAQPQLLPQWPAHQRLFLEDEISKTTYEATGSIVAAAAAFSLREEIIGGTIAEEKFVPFVREVATLVQKTRSQIKH
jgi:hypothetical protein